MSAGDAHGRAADHDPADGDAAARAALAERRAERTGADRARQDALLYVQRLTKLYQIKRGLFGRGQLLHALNGVSFYVRRRETFGVVGESGSGKSTLGRCLLRLIEPTLGRVVFDGRDITALEPAALRPMRQRMQIVFQDPYSSLDPSMTVNDIVREGIDVFRLAKSHAQGDERVATVLAQVGLRADVARRYPHELSGGQRQRVAIARALAVQPDFIVLDEPLSALDLSVQAQIVNLLDELQQQLGLSLLLISHDLRAVQYLSHRLAVMIRGRIVEMGPTESVARRQHHPYTRALFGAMPATFWTGAPKSGVEREPPGERAAGAERSAAAELGPAELPSALEALRGCPFYSRCPRPEPGQCDMHMPDLLEIVPRSHHRTACWHPHTDALGFADAE
jgi:oligopeptide/dipeptide ABC transporter ATP-binding protein